MTIKAFAVCALVMLSTPAAAQGWGPYGTGGYGPVGYPEIRASLRDHGLRPISQPILSGRTIVIRAVDRTGEPVRVLMSARFGDVIEVTPLPSRPVVGAYEPRPFRPYAVYPERRYGTLERPAARPDLMAEPPESVPPNAGPNGSDPAPSRAVPPNAAPRTAAVTPNRTPTPRPRPPAAGATAAVTPAPAATDAKPAPAPAAGAPKQRATAAQPKPAAPAASPVAPAVTGSTPPPDGRHTFPPANTLE